MEFCEENRNNFRASKHHRAGAMKFKKIKNLSHTDYIKECSRRQSKAAIRTKDIKRIKTAAKIKVAFRVALRRRIKLTYSNIAKLAKISLSTVKRYSKIIKILGQKTNGVISSIRVIVLKDEGRSILPLKYWIATTIQNPEPPI